MGASERAEAVCGEGISGTPEVITCEVDVLPAERRVVCEQIFCLIGCLRVRTLSGETANVECRLEGGCGARHDVVCTFTEPSSTKLS